MQDGYRDFSEGKTRNTGRHWISLEPIGTDTPSANKIAQVIDIE